MSGPYHFLNVRILVKAVQDLLNVQSRIFLAMILPMIFSSPEPKAHGELIVYQSSRRPSVCASTRASTHLNINISETRGPIATKFYLKHHWDEGKAVLGFRPDRIGTLVSRATDSFHRVIMGKISLAL